MSKEKDAYSVASFEFQLLWILIASLGASVALILWLLSVVPGIIKTPSGPVQNPAWLGLASVLGICIALIAITCALWSTRFALLQMRQINQVEENRKSDVGLATAIGELKQELKELRQEMSRPPQPTSVVTFTSLFPPTKR